MAPGGPSDSRGRTRSPSCRIMRGFSGREPTMAGCVASLGSYGTRILWPNFRVVALHTPSLEAPVAHAAVRDSNVIRGSAADLRFAWYRLDDRAAGAATWTVLVDTTRTSVSDGVLGGWNTRSLADGSYELRLAVADTL